MHLTPDDHARVTAAVTAAEAQTDGEIVTIVARQSDAYHDVALHWALLAMLLAVALLATFPASVERLHAVVDPWNPVVGTSAALTIALVVSVAVFLLVRLILAAPALRIALTPKGTKARRVRARALTLFRTGAEKRTIAATGVLLYLSLGEHRAELIADASIHDRVSQDEWGAAMAALIVAVKDDRPADGMVGAVSAIGRVLAEHFPRSEGDTNELPDRLIEL